VKAFSGARQTAYWVAFSVCILALIYKFFWSYVHFDVPLGYDVGMYRYLFLKHGAAFPPFILGDVQDWAKDHPLGLFIIMTPLIKAGVPVDWLIGWIWNCLSILLVLTVAWATSSSSVFAEQKHRKALFLATLAAGTLSLPLYDGFVAMYWKTIVSLLFVVWSFALIERQSYWAIPTAIFALVTHNQTGLVFVLSVVLWWMIQERVHLKNLFNLKILGAAFFVCILAWLLYLPVYHEAIGKHIVPFLTQRATAQTGGAFPDLAYYTPRYGIMMAFSIVGFLYSLKQKQFTLWHTAVFWSGLFVFAQVFFYRRFILHFDFFLLPFAGYATVQLWKKWNGKLVHIGLIFALCIQGYFLWQMMHERWPVINRRTYEAIQQLPGQLSEQTLVVGYENITALWLRGWLPNNRVVAPGFFEPFMSQDDWEYFLTADADYRRRELGGGPSLLFLFLPQEFIQEHGDDAYSSLVQDPCFKQNLDIPELLESVCSPTR